MCTMWFKSVLIHNSTSHNIKTLEHVLYHSNLCFLYIATQNFFSCRDNFFREPNFNACVPICPDWRQDSIEVSITIDVVVFLAYFSGFVASIAVLVISVIRYEAM